MDIASMGILAALVVSGSSVMAWVKFFMELGAMRKEAVSATAMATSACAQTEMLRTELTTFKVENAHEHGQVMGIEMRIQTAIADLRADVRRMTDRVDRALDNRTES